MVTNKYDYSAVTFREKIYIIGGVNQDKVLRSAEVFDTKTNHLTALMDMHVPRHLFAAAISEHKLYCFGGNYHNVESFDLYKEKWLEESRCLPTCRSMYILQLLFVMIKKYFYVCTFLVYF